MADPFVGEIRILPYNYAPRDWYNCDGSLVSIQQDMTLFSLITDFYGGNGTTNFALPDLDGRAAMGWGTGAGLTPRTLGGAVGTPFISLQTSQMPPHSHPYAVTEEDADRSRPTGDTMTAKATGGPPPARRLFDGTHPTTTGNQVHMAATMVEPTGNTLPHENHQPFLAMRHCIASVGAYPTRS